MAVLAGVRGWLLVFVVVQIACVLIFTLLPIIGTLRALAQAGDRLNPDWLGFTWFVAGWEAIKAIAILLLAFLMARDGRWRSVRLNIAGLWVFGPAWRLIVDVAAWTLFRFDGYNIAWHYMGPILYCSVWTIYLLKSRRVAETYARPRADTPEALAETFE